MAKTVELIDLIVKQINLDYVRQCVIVLYDLIDSSNQVWESGDAYFWVQIPPVPPFERIPNNWFQLPSNYFPTLVQLRTDADQALTNRFLV
jgi:hypothetical protein